MSGVSKAFQMTTRFVPKGKYMQIIISPAKKMRTDTDSFDCQGLPVFIRQAEQLVQKLQSMTPDQLRALWKCNDQILQQNIQRLEKMNLRSGLTPAILAYDGIQYQYMAPGVFTDAELIYIQKHLRILSGLYGVLRPFDGVTPYRLEMQAKLQVNGQKDLYAYWGRQIADQLSAESSCILNLASKEYSRCVSRYLKDTMMITCIFAQQTNGKLVEKGTLCKMARGEMVRYLAENQIDTPEGVRAFDRLGYRYLPEKSTEQTYLFIKEEK